VKNGPKISHEWEPRHFQMPPLSAEELAMQQELHRRERRYHQEMYGEPPGHQVEYQLIRQMDRLCDLIGHTADALHKMALIAALFYYRMKNPKYDEILQRSEEAVESIMADIIGVKTKE